MNIGSDQYHQYNDAEFDYAAQGSKDLGTGVPLNSEFTPDTYYCNQCLDASGNQPQWFVYNRCNRCNNCNEEGCNMVAAGTTQRRIQNTVRVSQSEYLENLAGLNVYVAPIAKYGLVNWNQGSDRAEPGRVMRNVPSYNASSTKTSITRMRPGSCSAAGEGVDIKHGSYARYLARIKGRGPYRTESQTVPPVEGNKTKKYGIAYSHRDDKCLCPL
jgi:hypothetical protein